MLFGSHEATSVSSKVLKKMEKYPTEFIEIIADYGPYAVAVDI